MNLWHAAFLFTLPLMVLACSANSDTSSKEVMPAAKGSQHKPAGKSAAQVNIEYELSGKPSVSQPLDIRLSFVPARDLQSLTVRFTADEGLALATPNNQISLGESKARSTIAHTLQVIPMSDGLFYVHVFIEAMIDGEKRIKVGSIPVATNGSTPKQKSNASGNVVPNYRGSPVIIMPGTETKTGPGQ